MFVIQTVAPQKFVSKVLQCANVFTSDSVNRCRKAQTSIKMWICRIMHICLCPFLLENATSSETCSESLRFAYELYPKRNTVTIDVISGPCELVCPLLAFGKKFTSIPSCAKAHKEGKCLDIASDGQTLSQGVHLSKIVVMSAHAHLFMSISA